MSKQKSFTLIELLVVIVIIGILAGVIMISTSSSIDKANMTKGKVFSESVKNDLMLNLIAEWKFNEVSGVTSFDSWSNNNGTLINFNFDNTDGWKSGNKCVDDGCIEFDGLDDAITFNAINLKNIYTIEAWVWPDDQTSTDWFNIVSNANQPQFGCADDNLILNFYNRIVAISSLKRHMWSHILLVRNDSNYSLYINGKIDKIASATAGDDTYRVIGAFAYNSVNITDREPWHGLMDEIRLYQAALPSSQIKQNYIAGLNSMLSNGSISKEEYNERINTLAYDKLYSQ